MPVSSARSSWSAPPTLGEDVVLVGAAVLVLVRTAGRLLTPAHTVRRSSDPPAPRTRLGAALDQSTIGNAREEHCGAHQEDARRSLRWPPWRSRPGRLRQRRQRRRQLVERAAVPRPPTSGSGSTARTRPQDARDWLKTTFEDQNPGSTLTIEQQEWDGLVEKLTTSLSSESETPDVVEIGNTQAPTFTSAGAFSDMTDQLGDLGGDDLLQGFVDGATVDGKTYAVPYYAGSKYIFYRKDLFKAAGIDACRPRWTSSSTTPSS